MRILILTVFLCCAIPGYSQKIQVDVQYMERPNPGRSDTIYYDALRKLVWSDFQGEPNPNYAAQAMAATGFSYHTEVNESSEVIQIKITVYSYFLKDKSWRKASAVGAFQLEHEQRHFDIAYLGAKRFISRLKAAKFKSKNYKTLPNKLFVQTFKENEEIQRQYDAATNHSIDAMAQAEWNKRIDEMLTVTNKTKE